MIYLLQPNPQNDHKWHQVCWPVVCRQGGFHTTAIYLSQVGDALLGYNLRYLQTTDNPAVGSVNYFPPFFHFRRFLN